MVGHSALDYAKKGYCVLPVHGIINEYCTCGKHKDDGHKAGKHPACEHGYKDATMDVNIIETWWRDKPWANVAITTHGGRFFVLESDPCHGGDKTIAELVEKHVPLPLTPTVKSGGGGTHWYFRYPLNAKIRSRSDVAKGVDVRGEGGYVVAPPSIHKSGNRYEWITPLDTPLADAPAWVLALACESKPGMRTTTMTRATTTPTQGAFTIAHELDFATHPGAFEGSRNGTILRLIGTHFARGDDPERIEELGIAWGERCDPPIPYKDVLRRIRAIERKREADADDIPDSNPDDGLDDGVNSFPERKEGINSDDGGDNGGEQAFN